MGVYYLFTGQPFTLIALSTGLYCFIECLNLWAIPWTSRLILLSLSVIVIQKLTRASILVWLVVSPIKLIDLVVFAPSLYNEGLIKLYMGFCTWQLCDLVELHFHIEETMCLGVFLYIIGIRGSTMIYLLYSLLHRSFSTSP